MRFKLPVGESGPWLEVLLILGLELTLVSNWACWASVISWSFCWLYSKAWVMYWSKLWIFGERYCFLTKALTELDTWVFNSVLWPISFLICFLATAWTLSLASEIYSMSIVMVWARSGLEFDFLASKSELFWASVKAAFTLLTICWIFGWVR